MSADNWAICPYCLDIETGRRAARLKEIEGLYGKVDAAKFLALSAEIPGLKEDPRDSIESSLREDYEIGVDPDREFFVSYRGGCQRCGFVFEWKHSELTVAPPAKAAAKSAPKSKEKK